MPAVSHQWKNWSGNQEQTTHVEVVKPTNVAQLRAELMRAEASGMKARPVGTGHAWAELIANEGQPLMVFDMQRWEGDMVLDRSDDTVTFPAGWRLDRITKRLAAEGYQINSPPVYEKMNIGGLIGTASHGTGDGQTETMSDHLIGFKMMTPSGNVVSIDKSEPMDDCKKELLRAVRCSMGTLGIVYEVTLRVSPAYMVREHDFLVPLQEGLDHLDDIVESNMFVEMFWVPFSKSLWFKAYNHTNPVHRFRLSSIYYWIRDKGMYLFQLLAYPGMLARRAPVSDQWRTRGFLKWIAVLLRTMMGDRIVTANTAFHFQKTLPKIIALAFVVRRDEIVDLWRYLIARVKDRELMDLYPTNVMVESRFIRRSQDVHGRDDATSGPKLTPSALLSPAVFDETAYVELVGYATTERMLEFFRDVERGVMSNFKEARPHWGKYFTLGKDLVTREDCEDEAEYERSKSLAARFNRNKVRSHYRMARFLRVRNELDPKRTMSNAFLEREVFLGGTEIPADALAERSDLRAIENCFPKRPVEDSNDA
jgi:hypothetical protein